jgi:hypothetical protein
MPLPISYEDKPEHLLNDGSGFAWQEGDIGYLWHEISDLWVKVVVELVQDQHLIIFCDDKECKYCFFAWKVKNVHPLKKEVLRAIIKGEVIA